MKTTIHKLSKDRKKCSLCGMPVPIAARAKGGEYVGVNEYNFMPPTAYRVGANNKDSLCDGTDYIHFHQESLEGEE